MEKTFRQIVREAADQADLSVRDRVKLRLVMRLNPAKLESEIFNQAQVEGVVPANVSLAALNDKSAAAAAAAAVDWAALAEFIKEVLPAILQIISLFL